MLKELGAFKQLINPILYNSENIRDILLGSDWNTKYTTSADINKELKKHIFSHLFIDDTITTTESYIYYDVYINKVGNTCKNCHVVVYALCHKDILENYYKKGYLGNRIDILCQMIEETFLDPSIIRQYGIGKLDLKDVKLYNDQKKFYGKILDFEVPNFR